MTSNVDEAEALVSITPASAPNVIPKEAETSPNSQPRAEGILGSESDTVLLPAVHLYFYLCRCCPHRFDLDDAIEHFVGVFGHR